MSPVKSRSRAQRIASALVVMAIMTALFTLVRREGADVVYLNAVVHSLDSAGTVYEAFAVAGGAILALGSSEEIRGRYDADSIVDLGGRAVIPGFVDAHARLLNAGVLALTLDVSGAPSAREAARIVGAHARTIPPGTWIRGRGWKNEWWPSETGRPSALLDSATQRHPVLLVGEDEAAIWVNSAALAATGISALRTEHEPGTIVRGRGGEPLGILLDEAAAVLAGSLPPVTDWELNAALDSAARACLRAGITTVHDFGLSSRELALYERRAQEGTLPVRIYGVIGGRGETWEACRARGPLVGAGGGMLTVRAIELYVDGALEPRSAALLEPYSDDASTRGMTFAGESELAGASRAALEHGFQVCMHATGDRAVRVALNAFTQALAGLDAGAGMLRLEGVQLADASDLARAAGLGAVISMQPARYLLDYDVAVARLGAARMARFMPWDLAEASGATLAGGTDMPLAPPEPLMAVSLVAARSRGGGAGRDTLQALRGAFGMFSSGSARAAFEHEQKGSLEPGKLADFLVLSHDPFRIDAGGLERVRVQATVLGGRIAFEEGRND